MGLAAGWAVPPVPRALGWGELVKELLHTAVIPESPSDGSRPAQGVWCWMSTPGRAAGVRAFGHPNLVGA